MRICFVRLTLQSPLKPDKQQSVYNDSCLTSSWFPKGRLMVLEPCRLIEYFAIHATQIESKPNQADYRHPDASTKESLCSPAKARKIEQCIEGCLAHSKSARSKRQAIHDVADRNHDEHSCSPARLSHRQRCQASSQEPATNSPEPTLLGQGTGHSNSCDSWQSFPESAGRPVPCQTIPRDARNIVHERSLKKHARNPATTPSAISPVVSNMLRNTASL